MRPTSLAELEVLCRRAVKDPIGCDISNYSDEWCAGFLQGQVNVLQALARRLECDCLTGCYQCCS